MKYIQKKIVSELPKTVGSITDTLNVEDKSRNAPSINLVQMMAGVPTEGIIAYETEDGSIPEGYEEVENPDLAADESYVNIKDKIILNGKISDLEIHHAYAKKRYGFTSLKIILKTSSGWPTTDIGDVITLPTEYKSSVPLVSFCRMHSNYNYPVWNGTDGEFIGFLYMGTNSMNIRTRQTGMKVAVIDLVY